MENTDKYEVYTQETGRDYYYKNGLLHREAGPAIVLVKDKKIYSNLEDKNLYKPMDKALYPPLIDLYTEDNFQNSLFNILSNESEYYLEGKEYSQEEFKVLVMKKDLESQLQRNETIGKKLKI